LAHEVVALAGQVEGQLELGGRGLVVRRLDREHLDVDRHLAQPLVGLGPLRLGISGYAVHHRDSVELPRLQGDGEGLGHLLRRPLDRGLARRQAESTDESQTERGTQVTHVTHDKHVRAVQPNPFPAGNARLALSRQLGTGVRLYRLSSPLNHLSCRWLGIYPEPPTRWVRKWASTRRTRAWGQASLAGSQRLDRL